MYPVKLVRDNIGADLGGPGTLTYEPINDHAEHVRLLRKKLIEEALEYLMDPSLEELGDVLAVVDALVRADLGEDMDALHREMVRKANKRGGFDNGIVMFAHHPVDETPLPTPLTLVA
jgi:predicted house-cleaning noncanonical NTP pyrophosphatase (MazG superfamily)